MDYDEFEYEGNHVCQKLKSAEIGRQFDKSNDLLCYNQTDGAVSSQSA